MRWVSCLPSSRLPTHQYIQHLSLTLTFWWCVARFFTCILSFIFQIQLITILLISSYSRNIALIDTSSSTHAGLYFRFLMRESRSLPVCKAMPIALTRSNVWRAFTSQEVQTIIFRWQEEQTKHSWICWYSIQCQLVKYKRNMTGQPRKKHFRSYIDLWPLLKSINFDYISTFAQKGLIPCRIDYAPEVFYSH
jgi:hypothetical protein